ncbi:MAG: hypothetical protein ACXVJD_12025, partial [Mucilaginibacter sp.]
MDNLTAPVAESIQRLKKEAGFFQKLKKIVLVEKLYNPYGIIFLVLLSAAVAAGTVTYGMVFGALFLVVVIGVPVIYAVVAYPRFGIITALVMAYMLFLLMRIGISGPIGIIMDALQALLMLGMIITLKKEQNWELI